MLTAELRRYDTSFQAGVNDTDLHKGKKRFAMSPVSKVKDNLICLIESASYNFQSLAERTRNLWRFCDIYLA